MNFLFESVVEDGRDYFSKHVRAFDSPQYFERYLLSGLADDDVSDALVGRAIDELLAGEPSSAAAELVAIIDGTDTGRSMLALEKCIRLRMEANDGSTSIAAFLRDRLEHQGAETLPSFDVPKGQLTRWSAREVLLCIQQGLSDVSTTFADFGEDQTFTFLYQSNGSSQTRQLAKQVAPAFLSYVVDQTKFHLEEVLADRPRLAAYIDLAVFADEVDAVAGILDPLVGSDVDLFTRCVESFGYVRQWVGSSYSYEIGFRKELYEISLGEVIRTDLAARIQINRELSKIENDDLEEPPPEQDLRDFARASAKALSASTDHDSGPDETSR